MYVMDFVIWRHLSVNARILLNWFVRNGTAFMSASVLAATASLTTCWAGLRWAGIQSSESGITDRVKIVAKQSLLELPSPSAVATTSAPAPASTTVSTHAVTTAPIASR